MGKSVIIAALMVSLGAAPAVLAEPPAKLCGDGSGEVLATCIDDILIVQGEIVGKIDTMVEELAARSILRGPNLEAIQDQVGRIRNAHGRAQGEHGDLDDDDYQELMGSVFTKGCKWKDSFAEPSDGTCDKDERKENLCEKVCELDDVGQGKKDKKRDRFQADLTDALSELDEVNETLDDSLATLQASWDVPRGPGDDECPANYSFLGANRMFPEMIFGFRVASDVLDGVRDVSERVCDAAKVGFNGAAVCTVFEIAYHIPEGAYQALNAINEDINEAEIEATYLCVEKVKKDTANISNDVSALTKQLKDIEGQIDGLETKVQDIESLGESITRLVLTPQGQRFKTE